MDICTANNQFTIDVLSEISKDVAGQNIVFSSMSIMISLAMVYLGAQGNTANQMSEVLYFDEIKDVNVKFKRLLNDMMNHGNDYQLNIVKKLFGEQTFKFLQSYLDAVNNFYGAPLEMVDFLHNPEITRQQINSWIQQQTKGKIQNLLPEDSVSPNTALAVANTLYFLANWTAPFSERGTTKAPFILTPNEQVIVNMMNNEGIFNTNNINSHGITILELPYGLTKALSMFILLPDNNTVLAKMDKGISYEKLSQWTSSENMNLNHITVQLPRFRMEQRFSLRKILSSLGMSSAFSQVRANFSGMEKFGKLYLSDVYHKTFIEVNEKGTEAASATAGVVSIRSIPDGEFKADRPFHFFIRHNRTKCILLYGKLCKP